MNVCILVSFLTLNPGFCLFVFVCFFSLFKSNLADGATFGSNRNAHDFNTLSRNVNYALFGVKLGTNHAVPSNVYCITELNVCIIDIIKQLFYALLLR